MEHRRFTALLTLLVAMMAIQKEAEAQQLPRLVVCITVNELRGDYLDELSPLMGNDGLKRILNTASLKSNVSFPLYQLMKEVLQLLSSPVLILPNLVGAIL